jgi:hypothetical protein
MVKPKILSNHLFVMQFTFTQKILAHSEMKISGVTSIAPNRKA